MGSFVVGDVLAEKYEIKAVLGAGGMGTVYRARQIDLGRDVAIKVPNPQALEVPGFLTRFSREARLVAKLVHDNIVQVYEYQETEKEVYIVMEYVEGQDLKALILKPPANLTVKDMATILRASCEGLAHAHESGIVHRDIKPHNIMVQQRARGKWRVKIMDFGIAHMDANASLTVQSQEQLTATGQAIGTPSYMSPEQIRGTGVTAMSDIYSFGCVAFFSFTRQTPFQGTGFTVAASHLSDPAPSIRSRVPSLPDELEKVINQCLEKDPARRPQDCSDLGQEFYDALKSLFDTPMADIWPKQGALSAGTDVLSPTAPVGGSGGTDASAPTMRVDVQEDPIPGTRFTGGVAKPSAAAPSVTGGAAGPKTSVTAPTKTTPSQLSEPTIPYDQAAAASEAVPGEPARGMSPIKLVLILGVVILVVSIMGVGIGIMMRGQSKSGGQGADPTPIAGGDPVGVEPTPDPGTVALVNPTPTIELEPTPEPLVATPRVTPTASPIPSPTADPILLRISSLREGFASATSLVDRVQRWRDASTDPRFGDDPRMQQVAEEFALEIVKNPEMQRIGAGTFTMGSPPGEGDPEERPQFNVRYSAYEIGLYEVTATEFATFLNSLPQSEANTLYKLDARSTVSYNEAHRSWEPAEGKELHPANNVSWEAASRYTKWLTDISAGNTYRLPTEAEWENAARGGSSFMYPWGNNEPDARRARFDSEVAGTIAVVEMSGGRNSLGLSHMSGNVAEWCYDWYVDRAYDEGDRVDPRGPVSAPTDDRRPKKVLRGGSFQTPYARDLRVTRRDRLEPDRRQADVGFRLVREVK